MKKALFILLIILGLAMLLTASAKEIENTNENGKYLFEIQEDGTAKLTTFNLNEQDRTEFCLPDTVYDPEGNAYTVTDVNPSFSLPGVSVVSIPDSITLSSENEYRFFCGSAKEFRVSDSHPTMAVIDGVLFNKAEKALIRYPQEKQDTDYTIPDGIETIAPFAFNGNSSLCVLTVPNSVIKLGHGAFLHCRLNSLQVAKDHPALAVEAGVVYSKTERVLLTTIGPVTRCLIPEGIVRIGDYAFYLNNQIDTVQTPSTLTEICAHAFDDSSVRTVLLSEGLEYIGDYAFKSCDQLTEIILPESLQEIGEWTFLHDKFPTLHIPENVKKIGKHAFAYSKVSEITLPEGLLEIGDNAFSDMSELSSMILPGSLHTIGEGLFLRCGSLESITVGDGITELPDMMFTACDHLYEVNLPSGLKTIGSGVFYNCSSLCELTLPDSLESIEYQAFYGCNGLQSLVIPSSVNTIANNAFDNTSGLVLTVSRNSAAEAACLKNNWAYVLEGEADLTMEIPDWLKPTDPPVLTECPECGYQLPEGNDFTYCPNCAFRLKPLPDTTL